VRRTELLDPIDESHGSSNNNPKMAHHQRVYIKALIIIRLNYYMTCPLTRSWPLQGRAGFNTRASLGSFVHPCKVPNYYPYEISYYYTLGLLLLLLTSLLTSIVTVTRTSQATAPQITGLPYKSVRRLICAYLQGPQFFYP
jgi:hypothetical protein